MPVIALFGASGATGQAIGELALSRGYGIRALVRSEGCMPGRDNLVEIVGALGNPGDVGAAVESADAVCCVFGPRPPYTDIFCRAATQVVTACMKEREVRRLLCQTGAMVGHYPANRTLPFRIMESVYRRRLPDSAADRDGQEEVVTLSGLEWTLVKPPRLTGGRGVGQYRCGPRVKVGMLSAISRRDLAAFTLDAIDQKTWVGEAVFFESLGSIAVLRGRPLSPLAPP